MAHSVTHHKVIGWCILTHPARQRCYSRRSRYSRQVRLYQRELEAAKERESRLLALVERKLLAPSAEPSEPARKPAVRRKPAPPMAPAKPAPKPARGKLAARAPSPAVAHEDEPLGEMFKRRWGSEGRKSVKAAKQAAPKTVKTSTRKSVVINKLSGKPLRKRES